MRSVTTTRTLAMLLGLAVMGSSVAQEALPGRTVESLLDYAKSRNPDYAAMRHEAEAASERVYPAGALPDPILRTELQNVTNFGAEPVALPDAEVLLTSSPLQDGLLSGAATAWLRA